MNCPSYESENLELLTYIDKYAKTCTKLLNIFE